MKGITIKKLLGMIAIAGMVLVSPTCVYGQKSLPAPGSGGTFRPGQSSLPAPGSGGSYNPAPVNRPSNGGLGPVWGPNPGWTNGPGWNNGFGPSFGPSLNIGININAPTTSQGSENVIACGYDNWGIFRQIPMYVSYYYDGFEYDVTVINAYNPRMGIWYRGIDVPAYSTTYYMNGNTYNYYVPLSFGTFYFNI